MGEKDHGVEFQEVNKVLHNSIGWAINKDLEMLYNSFAEDEDYLEVHPEDNVVKGMSVFRKMEKFWLDEKFKAIGHEIRELQIKLAESGKVAWFFCRLDDMNQWDGKPLNWMNVRWTGVMEKRSGVWRIVQQHFSYPEKQRKPVAHVICGFIASGKTTFAKKLEDETGAIRFTKDDWIIEIFGNDLTTEELEQYDDPIIRLAEDIAFRCLRSGKDIIIDDGLWVREQRDDMRNRIQNAGAECKLYYMNCSMELMRQRALGRKKNKAKDSFHVDEVMFDHYLKYFQPMEDDEEYLLVETGDIP
ncbi:AAA family ATPase [Candidatus Cloacimonadota bacterium]